jgi:hypothetical protein
MTVVLRTILTLAAASSFAPIAPSWSLAQEAVGGMPGFAWVTQGAPSGPIGYSAAASVVSRGVADRSRPEYDAQGIRSGSMILYPSLMSSLLYDDNVYARNRLDPKKQGDLTYRVAPGLFLKSDWNRHSFAAYGTAEFVGYQKNENLNHINGVAGFDSVIDIQRDKKWAFGGKYERQNEAFGVGESVGNFDKPVIMDRLFGYTSYTQTFNRVRLGLLGTVKDEQFTDTVASGVKVDQSYRDNTQYAGAVRAGYETGPGTVLFAEAGADRKQFKTSIFTSNGYRGIVGVETDFSKLVKGEVYAGYAHRNYENTTLGELGYFSYGGNLSWYATQLLTVSLLAGRDVNETLNAGLPGTYINSSVGMRIDYELLRNLILTARGGYEYHSYNNTNRHEELVRTGLGATYLVSRYFTVGLDYNRLDYAGTVAGTDYARNQYGLTVKSKF